MALEALGVMRMAFTPAAIMFCTAVTWLSLSPSAVPAEAVSWAPILSASAWAASRMETKYGFESVLVISPILTGPLLLPPPPLLPLLVLVQPVSSTGTASAVSATARTVRDVDRMLGPPVEPPWMRSGWRLAVRWTALHVAVHRGRSGSGQVSGGPARAGESQRAAHLNGAIGTA